MITSRTTKHQNLKKKKEVEEDLNDSQRDVTRESFLEFYKENISFEKVYLIRIKE